MYAVKNRRHNVPTGPFQDFTEHGLEFVIDSKELFDRLLSSNHMRTRGYEILYARDHASMGSDIYALCFKTYLKKYFYLHLRFEFGQIDTIYYLLTMREGIAIIADLNIALQEAKP